MYFNNTASTEAVKIRFPWRNWMPVQMTNS